MRLAGPVPPEPLDLLADEREPAERGHLADDPRVVARVRRRRHESRELVDPFLAADVHELAPLVELVGDRDRVHRLAVLVEVERCEVDLPVRLAVEVAGVDDLAHRLDRRRREHHRAEDGFLGVEVLRRDRGGGEGLGRQGHQRVVKPGPEGLSTVWIGAAGVSASRLFAAILEQMFA